jgi:hypothetical protein
MALPTVAVDGGAGACGAGTGAWRVNRLDHAGRGAQVPGFLRTRAPAPGTCLASRGGRASGGEGLTSTWICIMAHGVRRPLRVVAAVCALAACGTAEARDTPAAARKLHVIQGFGFPESVRYDSAQDVYFVSNMAGPGSRKDGNGFIVRIGAATCGGRRC